MMGTFISDSSDHRLKFPSNWVGCVSQLRDFLHYDLNLVAGCVWSEDDNHAEPKAIAPLRADDKWEIGDSIAGRRPLGGGVAYERRKQHAGGQHAAVSQSLI